MCCKNSLLEFYQNCLYAATQAGTATVWIVHHRHIFHIVHVHFIIMAENSADGSPVSSYFKKVDQRLTTVEQRVSAIPVLDLEREVATLQGAVPHISVPAKPSFMQRLDVLAQPRTLPTAEGQSQSASTHASSDNASADNRRLPSPRQHYVPTSPRRMNRLGSPSYQGGVQPKMAQSVPNLAPTEWKKPPQCSATPAAALEPFFMYPADIV